MSVEVLDMEIIGDLGLSSSSGECSGMCIFMLFSEVWGHLAFNSLNELGLYFQHVGQILHYKTLLLS